MRSSRSGKLILDSRLPDGSRLAAVFPPCSVGGTTLTIRKFQTRFFTADELVRIVTMTPEVLGAVRSAIEKNESILISGRDHYRQDDGAERARGVPAAD
jgi:pilus assembly protein CpaF